MITLATFFLSFPVTTMIIFMAALFIIGFNPCNLYNRIFNRRNYNLWRYFIVNADKFEYSYTYKNTVYYVAIIDGIKYEAIIWSNDIYDIYNGVRLTSIHKYKSADDICGECLLGIFDKESSTAMTMALIKFNN